MSLLSKVAVIVATVKRPNVVCDTVKHIELFQTLKPHQFIVSCVNLSDVGTISQYPWVEVVTGPAGLAAQRNTALRALDPEVDIVVFFDDDFVPHPEWIIRASEAFSCTPELVSYTGHVVVDDKKGPGLSYSEAVRIVDSCRPPSSAIWKENYSPYGCNMAFRRSSIGVTRFDERLVLYGWLEDRDFAASLAKKGGRQIKSFASAGVHMGVKGGRVSGIKLGFSQIINPIYIFKKGNMTIFQVFEQILRNVASNLVLSIKPEPFVDRRGRLRGNLIGIRHALKNNIAPEMATNLGVARTGTI